MTAINDMDVMILCGGLGTRLREETEFKPKPMVEIGGHPILWHIMRHYRVHGPRNFVLCLGYRGDVIRDYFVNFRRHRSDFAIDLRTGGIETLSNDFEEDWRVVMAETGAASLTGQRMLQGLRYVRGKTLFATYGDGVADIDINQLLMHHRRAGKLATVTAVHPSSRFGELSIEGGLVQSFLEKPQVTEGWINGGFFVFEKEAFAHCRADQNFSLEEGVLEKLAQDGQLAVYQHHGFWQCMDTFRETQLLNQLWSSGRAPWRTWDRQRLSA